MTRKPSEQAYSNMLKAVMQLLYDYDPDGIGCTIDAPFDEYYDLASILVARFKGSNPTDLNRNTVQEVIPSARPELIEELVKTQKRFESEARSEEQT